MFITVLMLTLYVGNVGEQVHENPVGPMAFQYAQFDSFSVDNVGLQTLNKVLISVL